MTVTAAEAIPGKLIADALPEPPPNLRRKLVNVMKSVGWVPKKGTNTFHGYKYATEADLADMVRQALIAEGLIFLPTITDFSLREVTNKKGEKSTVTRVNVHFTILDADSADTLEFDMPGEGQDPQDKGVYKAITGAEKYALMKLFLIPTGDDPEADSGGGGNGADKDMPKITREQEDKIRGKIQDASVPMSRFLERYEIATLAEMTAETFARAEKDLDDYKAQLDAAAAKGKKP